MGKKKRNKKRKNAVSAEKHDSIYEDRTVYERGPRHDDFWQDYDPYHERPSLKKRAPTASSRFAKEYDSDYDERPRRGGPSYPPMRPGYGHRPPSGHYGPPMRYGPPPHMRNGYPPSRGAPRGYHQHEGQVRPGQYAGNRPFRMDRDRYESLEHHHGATRGGPERKENDRNSRNKPRTAVVRD